MKRGLGFLAAATVALWTSAAQALISFTVSDIRLEGLERVSPGLVFRNFPLGAGDHVDDQGLSTAIRTLFSSGYFNDIAVSRDGDVLVLELVERPSVSLIRLDGNSVIKDEDLLKGLANSGLKEGEIFKRATLDRIRLDLLQLYTNQGRYDARVEAEVEPLPGNRVAVNITINEGEVATIRHINIVGNTQFSDEELKKQFQMELPDFWSFYTKADRYAEEKLQGDLERLRSFYLDRGYINFAIDSHQVAISPDRRSIFVTINISEGEQHRLRVVDLAGEMVVPEAELEAVLRLSPGDIYSRKGVNRTREALAKRIGDEGYLFANVAPVPEVHDDKTVTVRYFLNPGKRTYVRRINIKGNTRTSDEVIRREMRQMEAAIASSEQIEQSKLRLEKTGFFAEVNVETLPVAGVDDQVDIEYTVVEQQSGSLAASVGYSQGDGLLLSFSIQQDNFLGTGKNVGIRISDTDSTTEYSFSSTDPYYTVDGVSRGYELYYRKRDFDEDDASAYSTNELGAGITFGYPIDDYQRLNFGATLEGVEINTAAQTPQEVLDFIAAEGDSYLNLVGTIGWRDNRLNKGLMPTRGYSQSASLEMAIPGSDLTYMRGQYNFKQYQPLSDSEQWIWSGWTRLGYGAELGSNSYPFYKHFFAGGMRSIRGFKANTLGPRDTPSTNNTAEPFGGNLLLTGGMELIFPTPFLTESRSVRTLAFVDAGNVFSTDCAAGSQNCSEGVEVDEIRYSAGLALSWLTPMGPLSFVLARPLNEKAGDETETFQFTFGRSF